jgi:predicted DCC family thiol-disulfide oxidoreductase YuxK
MIVFFDGVCNLCTNSVKFIIERDDKNVFRFSSLQSDFAKRTLNLPELGEIPQSLILLKENKIHTKSTAALLIAKELKGAWPLFTVFLLVPSSIRNFIYDWVAKNRYSWFGKNENCMIPTPELRQRFLET